MRRAVWRWAIGAGAGVVAGVAVAVTMPSSHEPPDPMRGVPPGGSTTEIVTESLADDPVYVDPDLSFQLSDDELASLHAHIDSYDLPTYVIIVRTGTDDGFRSFLPPRALRVAADTGRDGIYLAVNQARESSAAFIHDGEPLDSSYVHLGEGSLGPALETAIDELHDPEESGGYEHTRQWVETRFRGPNAGEIAGGSFIGVLGALSVYGVLMLGIGIARASRGLPFRPPRGSAPRRITNARKGAGR